MNDTVRILVGAAGAPWELPLVRELQRPELGVRVRVDASTTASCSGPRCEIAAGGPRGRVAGRGSTGNFVSTLRRVRRGSHRGRRQPASARATRHPPASRGRLLRRGGAGDPRSRHRGSAPGPAVSSRSELRDRSAARGLGWRRCRRAAPPWRSTWRSRRPGRAHDTARRRGRVGGIDRADPRSPGEPVGGPGGATRRYRRWPRPLVSCLQRGPRGVQVLAGLARVRALARGPRAGVACAAGAQPAPTSRSSSLISRHRSKRTRSSSSIGSPTGGTRSRPWGSSSRTRSCTSWRPIRWDSGAESSRTERSLPDTRPS